MNTILEECSGGVTAAGGFLAAGSHVGIKKSRKDLSLVYSTAPAAAAGVFTTSKVQAPPVLVSRQQLKASPSARCIVINSGNANACTGERGLNDAWAMVRTAAHALRVPEHQVLVSSTGVIGQYLPIARVVSGIEAIVPGLSRQGNTAAAEGIMTTDTFLKEAGVTFPLEGRHITIGGMAKGSGMIAPNMATMLAFITTDIDISPWLLSHALVDAAKRSFNRISVDGDTSTNDMVLILANGSAGNPVLDRSEDPRFALFHGALVQLLTRLSRMIVLDGEGATKFIEIEVTGAGTEEEAVRAARSVANSNLVKTALHGEDANWGRILAAIGYSGIDFDPSTVEITFGDVPILRQNYVIDFCESRARAVLQQKEIKISICLHKGADAASFWTCDLSREYVSINANYRT